MSKHAFLIIAHQGLELVTALLELLDDARNDLFIHVDRRAVELREQIESIQLKKASLVILTDPIEVHWGDISQVEVEYKLFEAAFASGPYAYYHLLSGADLPIKSQNTIHDFFQKNAGKEFVGFWMDETHRRDLRRKACRYHFFTKYFKGGPAWKHSVTAFVRNVCLAVQKVLPIHRNQGLTLQKGYNWVSITHDFCGYLIKQKPEVLRSFRYTLCPDEIFLQTVLWNSPFKERVFTTTDASMGSMRAIDWTRGNPYVWTENDLDELFASPYLFARKFSHTDSATIEKVRLALKTSL